MKPRYPGHDVALITALPISLIPIGLYLYATQPTVPWYMAAGMAIGVVALGMWFQIRAAGIAFGVLFLMGIPLGIVTMVKSGVSVRALAKVCGSVFGVWACYDWVQSLGIKSESETVADDDSLEG